MNGAVFFYHFELFSCTCEHGSSLFFCQGADFLVCYSFLFPHLAILLLTGVFMYLSDFM